MFITRSELLFLLFFTFACIQLFRNIEKHLDYSYKIVPVLSIKKFMNLPVVSLCLPNFIDEIKFAEKFPDLAAKIGNLEYIKRRKVRRSLYDTLTLKDLNSVSYSLKDVLKSCFIYDNLMNKVNCTFLSPYVSWISFEDKCFQVINLFSSLFDEINFLYLSKSLIIKLSSLRSGQYQKRFIYNRDSLVNQEWLVFKIKKERIRKEDIGILVSAPNELLQPFAYNTGYIQISLSLLDTLYIVIERQITKRLPQPFESDCKNYTGHSMSQIHCIYDCFYHEFKHQGKFPDQLLSRFPEPLYGKNLDKYNRTICVDKCKKKDCIIEQFNLKISYKKLGYQNSSSVKLVIKNSFAEHKVINFEPLTHNKNILSLVAFVLSPLAFWCGISLYTIHIYSINLIVYIIAFIVKIKKLFIKYY